MTDIRAASALPIVRLDRDSAPVDGGLMTLSETCKRNLAEGEKCREFYQRLRADPAVDRLQCPFGFSVLKFQAKGVGYALTGMVAHPRFEGATQRRIAKKHAENKTTWVFAENTKSFLQRVEVEMEDALREDLGRNYAALHEIRKLNRTAKQTAERLCNKSTHELPAGVSVQLTNIWKATELMSQQFSIIELLANDALMDLPLNTTSNPYRLFDKFVRLHNSDSDAASEVRPIILRSFHQDVAVRACDKTLPIIPGVLLDNAIRYKAQDTTVSVCFSASRAHLQADVVNITAGTAEADQRCVS